jgi:glycosyltransferase involved in cell wall biosynthesis
MNRVRAAGFPLKHHSMPAISVLIPALNASATVTAALESIAQQTFTDWEAIVVDDGSTDATSGILAEWARRDLRFRVLRNDRPQGLVASLNRAAAEVRSPVIARMDADDISHPTRFERQYELLSRGEVTVVGCRVRYFPEETVAGGARRYEAWLNSVITPEQHHRDIFVECPIAHPTLMLRTEALHEVGGYDQRGWAEDYDLLLRLWETGLRMAKVPEVLLRWREGERRTSRTHPDYTLEALVRCRAHYLFRSFLRGMPAVIFGAGPVGKSMARALMAEGATIVAWVDLDPRKIGQWVYGAPVLDQRAGLRLRGAARGVAALGQPGARDLLRKMLNAEGWIEGEDYRCAA